MNTVEIIIIAAALQLVTLGCHLIAIGEAWKKAAENFRKWQVALQAYGDEKAAHAKTHARLVKAQQVYKEECL